MLDHGRLPRIAVAAMLAGALAVGLSACGGSSSTKPAPMSQNQSDEIAQQIAVTSSASGWGSYTLDGGSLPTSPVRGPAPSTPYRAASWDTTYASDSLNYAFHLEFWTILGIEELRYNPLTTWKVVEDSDVSGTIDRPNYQCEFAHTGHIDFYGMRSSDDTLSFTGSAHDTAYSTFTTPFRQVIRYCHVDVVRTIDNVTIVRSAGMYPVSGSVRWVVVATYLRTASRADVEVVVNAQATLTFNGTRYAVLTVTNGESYSFDLETGAIARQA